MTFNVHYQPNNVARPVWQMVQEQGYRFCREIIVRAVPIDRLVMPSRVVDKCSNLVDFQAPKRYFLLACLSQDQQLFLLKNIKEMKIERKIRIMFNDIIFPQGILQFFNWYESF